MISDSPYDVGAPVLTPIKGIIAGIAAALAMLILIALVQPVSGVSPAAWLALIGRMVLPSAEANLTLPAGSALHIVIGAIFGLLYSLCQMQIAPRNLIGVGIFYGFVIWILGSLLLGWVFGEKLRDLLRSWPMLAAFLLYGLGLAIAAVWNLSRRPARPVAMAKD
ncbi:MAG TPA: DUF6789 family protein [Anaerolineae bacterium]